MKLTLAIIGAALLCGYSMWIGAGVFFILLSLEVEA